MMGDHRLPKRVMSGELENVGKRTLPYLTLGPGIHIYSTVREGGCRFLAAWVKEEENASEHRQMKREAGEADKVEFAPGVTVASLTRFRESL